MTTWATTRSEVSEYFPCVPSPDCPYATRPQGCHEIKAHLYYPESEYTTPLERVFRNLPENVEIRCRRFEEASHACEQPPVKPSRELMLLVLETSGVELSKTKRKQIYGRSNIRATGTESLQGSSD